MDQIAFVKLKIYHYQAFSFLMFCINLAYMQDTHTHTYTCTLICYTKGIMKNEVALSFLYITKTWSEKVLGIPSDHFISKLLKMWWNVKSQWGGNIIFQHLHLNCGNTELKSLERINANLPKKKKCWAWKSIATTFTWDCQSQSWPAANNERNSAKELFPAAVSKCCCKCCGK